MLVTPGWGGRSKIYQNNSKYTLPETRITLEYYIGFFWDGLFSGAMLVLGSVIWNMYFPQELLQIAAEGGVDLKSAVTRRFSMDQVNPGVERSCWTMLDVKGQMVDITRNGKFNIHPPKISMTMENHHHA